MASIITPERIADLIDTAPGWARVGITVANEQLRASARLEIAMHVYQALYRPAPIEGQLPLPL